MKHKLHSYTANLSDGYNIMNTGIDPGEVNSKSVTCYVIFSYKLQDNIY
jgi:hypothetical protein